MRAWGFTQVDLLLLGAQIPEAPRYEVWWQLYLEGLSTEWPLDAAVPPEFAEEGYPPSSGDFPPHGFHHRRHRLDFESSLFGLPFVRLQPSELPLVKALAAVETAHHLFVRGSRLDELRPRLKQAPTDLQSFSPIYARAHTDGSLADAMLHATFRADGQLRPFDHEYGEVDPLWAERLEGIDDLAQREHAQMLCQSAEAARCTGARCSLPGRVPPALEKLGALPVARWDFGEGQGALMVLAWPQRPT